MYYYSEDLEENDLWDIFKMFTIIIFIIHTILDI